MYILLNVWKMQIILKCKHHSNTIDFVMFTLLTVSKSEVIVKLRHYLNTIRQVVKRYPNNATNVPSGNEIVDHSDVVGA